MALSLLLLSTAAASVPTPQVPSDGEAHAALVADPAVWSAGMSTARAELRTALADRRRWLARDPALSEGDVTILEAHDAVAYWEGVAAIATAEHRDGEERLTALPSSLDRHRRLTDEALHELTHACPSAGGPATVSGQTARLQDRMETWRANAAPCDAPASFQAVQAHLSGKMGACAVEGDEALLAAQRLDWALVAENDLRCQAARIDAIAAIVGDARHRADTAQARAGQERHRLAALVARADDARTGTPWADSARRAAMAYSALLMDLSGMPDDLTATTWCDAWAGAGIAHALASDPVGADQHLSVAASAHAGACAPFVAVAMDIPEVQVAWSRARLGVSQRGGASVALPLAEGHWTVDGQPVHGFADTTLRVSAGLHRIAGIGNIKPTRV